MLLFSENQSSAVTMKGYLDAIETCTIVGANDYVNNLESHKTIICDIDFNEKSSSVNTKNNIERCRAGINIPVLYLTHRSGDAALSLAKQIDATVVMPRHASVAQILFTVRRLVEARRSALSQPLPPATAVISANVRAAAVEYADIITSIRCGKQINLSALERGSASVIAAVGGDRLSTWVDIVRSYDDTTYQHCLLVAGLAVSFAAKMGVSVQNQRLIGKAALIHDIGKLNIPKIILNKKGRLTSDEMDIIRTHPKVGYDMLVRQGGFDVLTLDMVRHHHEYLDGSGYPDGLSGNSISIFSRIMTICDIYAALVERRSYKEPMSSEEAITIIEDMSKKIDQNILRCFKDMVFQ